MKQSYDVLHIYWFHPKCVSQMIKVLWDWGCPEANCFVRNLSRLQHMVQLCFLFSGKRWVKPMIWLDSSPESVWVKMMGDDWVGGWTGGGEPGCTSPPCVRLDRPFSVGYRGAPGTPTAERPRWRLPEGAGDSSGGQQSTPRMSAPPETNAREFCVKDGKRVKTFVAIETGHFLID